MNRFWTALLSVGIALNISPKPSFGIGIFDPYFEINVTVAASDLVYPTVNNVLPRPPKRRFVYKGPGPSSPFYYNQEISTWEFYPGRIEADGIESVQGESATQIEGAFCEQTRVSQCEGANMIGLGSACVSMTKINEGSRALKAGASFVQGPLQNNPNSSMELNRIIAEGGIEVGRAMPAGTKDYEINVVSAPRGIFKAISDEQYEKLKKDPVTSAIAPHIYKIVWARYNLVTALAGAHDKFLYDVRNTLNNIWTNADAWRDLRAPGESLPNFPGTNVPDHTRQGATFDPKTMLYYPAQFEWTKQVLAWRAQWAINSDIRTMITYHRSNYIKSVHTAIYNKSREIDTLMRLACPGNYVGTLPVDVCTQTSCGSPQN